MFSPAYVDEAGQKTKKSWVECDLLGETEMLGFDAPLPDGCPYVLEHKLTEEALDDLEDDDAT